MQLPSLQPWLLLLSHRTNLLLKRVISALNFSSILSRTTTQPSEYQKYYLGVQYGTDFIPAYSHKFEYDGATSKPKVNSQALKISLGYTF